MLSHNETTKLIEEAQKGSESAKTTLVNENSPLIKSVIKFYRNKGVEYDDLYQLGCLGFVKAINNFDTKFDVKQAKLNAFCVMMAQSKLAEHLKR